MMNNHAPRSILKVDSICFKVDQYNSLIVYNINIPENYLQDRIELSDVLQRISNLIVQSFQNLSVLYQISASYILKHSVTGVTRTWTGSFFARNNELGVIADFQQFTERTFVTNSLLQLTNVKRKLQTNGLDTNWTVDRVLSVIFNIQCKVLSTHPLAGNKRHRQHTTFAL
jgi:hypothetical protein